MNTRTCNDWPGVVAFLGAWAILCAMLFLPRYVSRWLKRRKG